MLFRSKRFYPQTKGSVVVLQFVSVIDMDKITPYEELKTKYRLHEPYFIVSNQFWQHKNHLVILESLKLLSQKGIKISIVFTGKESDHRSPGYFKRLKDFVEKKSKKRKNALNELKSKKTKESPPCGI